MNYREYQTVNDKGDKITVRISLSIEGLYIADVVVKQKGKRKELFVRDSLHNDYLFRTLKGKERGDYVMNTYLKYVDISILNEALQNVWKQLKPQYLVIPANE